MKEKEKILKESSRGFGYVSTDGSFILPSYTPVDVIAGVAEAAERAGFAGRPKIINNGSFHEPARAIALRRGRGHGREFLAIFRRALEEESELFKMSRRY